MTIHNLIIHNLEKEIQGSAKLILSKNTLESLADKTISLNKDLNLCYRDSNTSYGIFRATSDDSETFQQEFDKYLADQTKENFIVFSINTINQLYNRIDSIKPAKGGYLIYADYVDDWSNRFLSVFFIRDKTDKIFKYKDDVINIDEVVCVDTDRLAMASRINIKRYQDVNNPSTYLSFVSVRQAETSDYFLNWIGAEKIERNDEDTDSLLKILLNIDPPEENGSPMEKKEFHRKAYDVIITFGKSPINTTTLSTTLFNDPSTISKYAEEKSIILPTEFVGNKRKLRALTGYHIKRDGIDLKFPVAYYGDKIKVNDESSFVTIHSEILAKAIKDANRQWKV